MNTGVTSSSKLLGVMALSGEAVALFWDLRWMLILLVSLLICDFRWGWRESKLLYVQAVADGNVQLQEKYKWHWSRAIRRTLIKTNDYVMFLLIGALVGLSITEQYDILSHTHTAALGALAALVAEGCSIWGHIKVVYKIDKKKTGILWILIKAFVRTKSEDLADAMEEVKHEIEHEERTHKQHRHKNADN